MSEEKKGNLKICLRMVADKHIKRSHCVHSVVDVLRVKTLAQDVNNALHAKFVQQSFKP